MVTFEQLHCVDLAALDAVAADFEQLVRGWDLATAMNSQVIGPLQGSGWSGPAADAAAGVLTDTRNQVDLAFDEASALARALRDAHTQFSAAQQALRAVIDDATRQKLTVDEDGGIRWPAAASEADRQDPGYEAACRHRAQEIQRRITAVLDQASEADAAAASALAGDTGAGTGGFNAAPVGGIAEAQAQQAAQLLGLGGKATDDQVAQLDRLLQEHHGDPRFATAFYGRLGPGGFLSNYALLAQSADFANSPGRSAATQDLRANLGLALATATSTGNQPHLSDSWEVQLRAAGAAHLPMYPGQPVAGQPYGYQVLASVLRTGSYDPHFLDPVAEHVTQLSRADPMMWDAVVAQHAYPFTDLQFLTADGTGFNPMAGVLEGLGHSPDAATHYFHDPATSYAPDGTARGPADPPINYLDLLTNTGPGVLDRGTDSILLDRDSSLTQRPSTGLPFGAETTALGHALQAATLGVPYDTPDAPLPPHTEAMSAVMADVVTRFGHADGPDLLHGDGAPFANLNASLGNMTAGYMGDVQSAVGGAMSPMPTNGELAHLDKSDTFRLLDTLGRDPDAYGSIAQAQQAYTTAQLQDMMMHGSEHPELSVSLNAVAYRGGIVQGIVCHAKAQELVANQQASDAAYNAGVERNIGWAKKGFEFADGKAMGAGPVAAAATPVNFVVDKIIDNVGAAYRTDTSGATSDAATGVMTGDGGQAAARNAVQAAGMGTGLSTTYVTDLSNAVVAGGGEGFAYGSGGVMKGVKDIGGTGG
ncbi:hypothetical protein GCM10009665_46190 [Kitasatospora nipponensis]|uniref:PPE family protein n=1 Tax=Kitasatospora nipponensis TaxID=258049 RepID=A0ABN1WHY7_9ACTN